MLSHINREKVSSKNPSQACFDKYFFSAISNVCFRSLDVFYHIETNYRVWLLNILYMSFICLFIQVPFTGPKEVGLFKVLFLSSSNVQSLVKT